MMYRVYELKDVLELNHFKQLLVDSQPFEYGNPQGKRTDVKTRYWMNQYNIPSFQKLCKFFNSLETKKYLGSCTGNDYSQMRTRIELCKDLVGSYLDKHVDDEAKVMTLQLYLTDATVSTSFINISTMGKANNAWFFHNTGKEIHHLEPLQQNRISVIVNYVNEKWRDESVLCTNII